MSRIRDRIKQTVDIRGRCVLCKVRMTLVNTEPTTVQESSFAYTKLKVDKNSMQRLSLLSSISKTKITKLHFYGFCRRLGPNEIGHLHNRRQHEHMNHTCTLYVQKITKWPIEAIRCIIPSSHTDPYLYRVCIKKRRRTRSTKRWQMVGR